MKAIVISNEESLRTEYFIKAGLQENLEIGFITYDNLIRNFRNYTDFVIKLEPPVYNISKFEDYSILTSHYINILNELSNYPLTYINKPQAILNSLDKLKCKKKIEQLPTTPILWSDIKSFEELLVCMNESNIKSVFIKPRFGAGAGGIIALRCSKEKIFLSTTLVKSDEIFYNSKIIKNIDNKIEAAKYIDVVLKYGAIVEKWIYKSSHNNNIYDLRSVCQFGNHEHTVVRCSKNVITNLHLNNNAKLFKELELSNSLSVEINELGIKANSILGLNYSGTDILIERESNKPFIIEVNGQGDHIYQDMFHNNKIYRHQILYAKEILSKR